MDYLPEEEKREAARRLGRGLLLGERRGVSPPVPRTWDEVLALAEKELEGLPR